MTPGRLSLMLITGDVALAKPAVAGGVDKILVDLERLGKAERQQGRGCFLSTHSWDDVAALRTALPAGALAVRLDPLHEGSADQIERALSLGADELMLPYFRKAETVLRFCDLVAGRVPVRPLVETLDAVRDLGALLGAGAVTCFHVGLNDLAMDLGRGSLNALWGDPILERIKAAALAGGVAFGVGGVTDPRVQGLPVCPRFVIAEQRRLGSTFALLGRSFKSFIGERPAPAAIQDCVEAIQAAYLAMEPLAD